ncbi:MAG: 30S ribosome-binding factor RbfA [Pseudomonadota bacterium]
METPGVGLGAAAAGPSAKGPSQRQQRVGESLRRALSDILMRGDAHDPDLARHSITVTEVRASPDLKQATVYVLPLGGRDADAALEALRRNRGGLRALLGRAVTLKYTPELHFQRDDSFDRMDETRRLLDQEEVRRDLAKPADPSDDATANDAEP